MNTCNGLTHSSSCTEEGLDIRVANEGSNEGNVLLDLPEGTQIKNQDGDVIYTVTGEPKKVVLKVPAV